MAPPAVPTNLQGEVDNSGTVTLTWDATLEGGTQFTIERQLNPVVGAAGLWDTLGSVSGKEFTDIGLPQGFANATYRVTAKRAGGTSQPTEPTAIYFGVPIADAA